MFNTGTLCMQTDRTLFVSTLLRALNGTFNGHFDDKFEDGTK